MLYELHMRDFSANDTSVPAPLRGTFKAFTQGRVERDAAPAGARRRG